LGIQLAFNRNGVLIALIFIGLPFVVRTVQPILEDVEKELEEAATCLGATRWQTFSRVIFPALAPALLTGFAMAFARAIGEYGSVIFIAGNMPMVSEITPLIIISKLEQYDYAGATAVALVMLSAAFVMLLLINGLQAWQRRPLRSSIMSGVQHTTPTHNVNSTGEPAWLRRTLIGIALVFVGLFLILPLAAVFTEALRKGVEAFLEAFKEPDAWSAIKLTLTITAIAVPLNLVFGVSAAWAIAKFEFRGQGFADHLGGPAVFGVARGGWLDLCAGVWCTGLVRTLAASA
jgi:ABC-type sulfate transport system permease component